MLLDACALDLVQLAESQNVVPNDVLLAIVLMEATRLDAIDEVVLHDDAGAPFIGIESPATVGIGVHVMNDVVRDGRCSLYVSLCPGVGQVRTDCEGLPSIYESVLINYKIIAINVVN